MPSVYLLHFSENYRHARHYIGFAKKSVETRFAEHVAGTGARLTQVVTRNGITLTLARVWKNQTRTFERSLKNKKHSSRLCPICTEQKKAAA